MKTIQTFIEQAVGAFGIGGDTAGIVTHSVLVAFVALLATLAGWLCRRLIIPVLLNLAAKTDAKWDDAVLNEKVLYSACSIVPAIVVWQLLLWTFSMTSLPSARYSPG